MADASVCATRGLLLHYANRTGSLGPTMTNLDTVLQHFWEKLEDRCSSVASTHLLTEGALRHSRLELGC
ncbi:Hypothetical predicted protein [Pelobates cultripes]|uniref:Uncharacterized protein n=1 Tax=Pelobates cultripes TaxID=61616 RepID=A0AAD1T4C7_PELCU|nr:Hypothetical predicted protein [Pelobates cultripes]